jgi:uncharacterized protein (TIGR02266 family)
MNDEDDPEQEGNRKSPRLPLILHARGDQASGVVENISEDGVFLQTDQQFAVGQSLTLTISFPGLLEPLELTGVVTWCRNASAELDPGVGVTFDGVPSRARAVISHLMQSHSASGLPGSEPLVGSTARHSLERAYRLLVVEDDVQWGLLYRRALDRVPTGAAEASTAPLIVDFATDGWEGLKVMSQKPYDLLLMDLSMEKMDGFRMLAQIRNDPKLSRTKIIVVSGAGPEALRRALEMGADFAVGKPVRMATIVETVRSLIIGRTQEDPFVDDLAE